MTARRDLVCRAAACVLVLCLAPRAAAGDELPEYRLKAAFVYNFMAYTEWPSPAPPALTLCVVGADPFGPEIDGLSGKSVGGRRIEVARRRAVETLDGCQALFLSRAVMADLPRILGRLSSSGVLTVADSPEAMRRGVMLNMLIDDGRITFEANLKAARAAGLVLSSKLLRLATEVRQ